MSYSPKQLASMIEHTLLKPEATTEQIDKLCAEAATHGFHGACVNPIHVARACSQLAKLAESSPNGNRPVVVSVVGFPLGASKPEVIATEASKAMADGATEIDMVVPLGSVIDGDESAVTSCVRTVSQAVHDSGGLLKVILETAALTDDQIALACRCCAEAQADFVKTSTGFHSAGGATAHHVKLLREHSGLPVKAAGGIRDAATAVLMVEAGATRLGASAGVKILADLQ